MIGTPEAPGLMQRAVQASILDWYFSGQVNHLLAGLAPKEADGWCFSVKVNVFEVSESKLHDVIQQGEDTSVRSLQELHQTGKLLTTGEEVEDIFTSLSRKEAQSHMLMLLTLEGSKYSVKVILTHP